MRVVNQRRDRIVNIDNYDISVDENHIYAIGDHRTVLLGTYDTDDRARGVFEDIIGAYNSTYFTTFSMPSS